jgi:integrase
LFFVLKKVGMGRVREQGNQRLGQYVQRRSGGRLEIRYPLPADVRNAFPDANGRPRAVLIKSLGTTDIALANSKAAILRVEWDRQVREARQRAASPDLESYLRQLYDTEIAQFSVSQGVEQTKARLGIGRAVAQGEGQAVVRSTWGAALLSDDAEERRAAAGWVVDRFYQDAMGRVPDRGSAEYADFVDKSAAVLVDALIAQGELEAGRQPGPPTSAILRALPEQTQDGNRATSANGNKRLSDYFENCYVPGVADTSERNIPVKRQTVGLFGELIANKPLYTITNADLWEFHDRLLELPDRRRLSASVRSLPASELARLVGAGELQALNPKTVNKHLTNMSAILKWGVKRRDLLRFVGEGVRADVDDDDEIARSFTRDELQRIFHLPLFSGCQGDGVEAGLFKPGSVHVRDDRFWIPLILLFTGARVAEVAGLECDDVVLDADVPHFIIRPNGRRRLKNKQSRRVVAIHPVLLDAGIQKFAEERLASGEPSFFPMIEQLHYRDRATGELRAKSLSQALILRQFNRTFLARAKADENGGSLKCFRHTFERESTNEIADVELRLRITGRQVGSSVKSYTSSMPSDPYERAGLLRNMRSAMEKIVYRGADFTHLTAGS